MLKALRGMNDILPDNSTLWQLIEAGARDIFLRFGYREIRTPILEEKSLFVKSIGVETDIVTKEMFAFEDRAEREVALRPEGTAPIVRAYLEANLHKTEPFQKLYYIGPMFRAERPQAGRLRQFHQIGAEAIGSSDPSIDAEMIILLTGILDSLKIRNYKLRINNLGCGKDKAALCRAIGETLSSGKAALCEDCRTRLGKNALRVLDCKKDSCRAIVRGAFKSAEFLCEDCVKRFKEVGRYLDLAGIKYEVDPYIVRGLDYYTGTVFEVSHPGLGAQDAIGAGGRYDNLISDLGGPALSATGFALGMERIIIAASTEVPAPSRYSKDKAPKIVYVATMGPAAKRCGFGLVNEFRKQDIRDVVFEMDYENKSLKAQMREADRLKARLVLIIGDDELKAGKVSIKDMDKKDAQVSVDRGSAITEVKKALC